MGRADTCSCVCAALSASCASARAATGDAPLVRLEDVTVLRAGVVRVLLGYSGEVERDRDEGDVPRDRPSQAARRPQCSMPLPRQWRPRLAWLHVMRCSRGAAPSGLRVRLLRLLPGHTFRRQCHGTRPCSRHDTSRHVTTRHDTSRPAPPPARRASRSELGAGP